MNVLKVPKGSSIVIFGVGAVGFAALMAAKTAQAETIIVIDIHKSRLDLALELGATHTILSKDKNISEEIDKACADVHSGAAIKAVILWK